MLEMLKERKEALEAQGKKGFTLMEMLIVIAIIAILIAIAIPIFTTQLERAHEATDAANIRAEYAKVMTDAITEPGTSHTATVKMTQTQDTWSDAQFLSGMKQLFSAQAKAGGDLEAKAGTTATITWTPPAKASGSNAAKEGTIELSFA